MTSSADTWILVPSRGRPGNVKRLAGACAKTCEGNTRLHWAFDDDDPEREASIAAAAGARFTVGPRKGLVEWTNILAARHLKDGTRWLASLGDDMEPVTPGWDVTLTGILEEHGPGVAWCRNDRTDEIPEQWVMSVEIVRALGWMMLPLVSHWYPDAAMRDIAAGAGCLHYRDDVLIKHWHPNVTGEPGDRTYADAAGYFHRDLAVYQRWRLRGMQAAVTLVRGVRAEAAAAQ